MDSGIFSCFIASRGNFGNPNVIFQVFLSIPYYKYFRDNNEIENLLSEAAHFYAKKLDIKDLPTINLHLNFPEHFTFYHGIVKKCEEKENTYNLHIMMNRSNFLNKVWFSSFSSFDFTFFTVFKSFLIFF